jgi:hypothetical protein
MPRRLTQLCLLPLFTLSTGCAFHTGFSADGGAGTNSAPPPGGRVDALAATPHADLIASSDRGGLSTSTSAPSAQANCGASMFGLEMLPPDVLIVLDRSGSMNDQASNVPCLGMANCQSKWAQMTPAMNDIVGKTAGTIRWGLTYFPSATGLQEPCAVNAAVSVPVSDGAASAIMASTGSTIPGGLTPTAAAITAAGTYLAGLTEPNPKYILLATDGQPNCASPTDPLSDDTNGAVQAVTSAKSGGTGVFVVGISTAGTTADTTLNKLAVAGGYPLTGSRSYYSVSSTADLVSALGMITKRIAIGCTFPLGKVPPAPDNIGIYADGTKVARDTSHTNGWDYNSGMTVVTIYGATCDALMAGRVKTVQAFIGCGFDPIP